MRFLHWQKRIQQTVLHFGVESLLTGSPGAASALELLRKYKVRNIYGVCPCQKLTGSIWRCLHQLLRVSNRCERYNGAYAQPSVKGSGNRVRSNSLFLMNEC